MADESKRDDRDPSAAGYDEAVKRRGDAQVPGAGYQPFAEEGRRAREVDETGRHAMTGQRGLPTSAVDEVAESFDEEQVLDQIDRQRQREGIAPAGEHRPDEEIRAEIVQRLEADGFVDTSAIQVTMLAGEARLAGSVDSRSTRLRAAEITGGVAGVTDVQNDIRARDPFYGEADRAQPADAPLGGGATIPSGAGSDASTTSAGGVSGPAGGSGGAGGAGLTDLEEARGRRSTTAPADDGLRPEND